MALIRSEYQVLESFDSRFLAEAAGKVKSRLSVCVAESGIGAVVEKHPDCPGVIEERGLVERSLLPLAVGDVDGGAVVEEPFDALGEVLEMEFTGCVDEGDACVRFGSVGQEEFGHFGMPGVGDGEVQDGRAVRGIQVGIGSAGEKSFGFLAESGPIAVAGSGNEKDVLGPGKGGVAKSGDGRQLSREEVVGGGADTGIGSGLKQEGDDVGVAFGESLIHTELNGSMERAVGPVVRREDIRVGSVFEQDAHDGGMAVCARVHYGLPAPGKRRIP